MMNMSLLYFVYRFSNYEVSYSKKSKNLFLRLAFKANFAELFLEIDSSKLYFGDQILQFRAKIAKISFATIYSAIIYNCENLCSSGKWQLPVISRNYQL